MPNADKIEIESIATQSAIADIDFDQQPKALDPSMPFKLYDSQGRLLAEPESIGSATGFEPGIYIARQGSKTLKIILGHQ